MHKQVVGQIRPVGQLEFDPCSSKMPESEMTASSKLGSVRTGLLKLFHISLFSLFKIRV